MRSGDVWVVGSRQFKDFDAYLLDSKRLAELRDQDGLSLDVVTDGNRYLNDRCKQLEQILGTVDALAQRGELPDAAIAGGELKITPLTNTVPEEATVLMRQAYALLPHVKITDLLLVRGGSLDGIQSALYSSKDRAALRRSYAAADCDPCGCYQPRHCENGGSLSWNNRTQARLARLAAPP